MAIKEPYYSKTHYAPGNIVDGAKIRRLREARGWTRDQLAEKVDMTESNIDRIERDDGNTSTGKVRALADALGVNPAILILGVDEVVTEALAAAKLAPITEPHRDIRMLRAFAGDEPAVLQVGTLKTEVPEELLGEILGIILAHKLNK